MQQNNNNNSNYKTNQLTVVLKKKKKKTQSRAKRKGIIQLIEIKCITLNLKAKKSQLKSNDKHKTKAPNVNSCNKVSTSLNINIYYER